MSKEVYLQELADFYGKNKVVPFIGAGLSIPFGVPDWGKIIRIIMEKVNKDFHPVIEYELSAKNYWKALEALMRYGNFTEFDIQQDVCTIIQSSITKNIPVELHNYGDLGKLAFKTFVTTNYDGLLYKFVEGDVQFPVDLSTAQVSSKEFFDELNYKRIWCLHGQMSNPGSIVITKEKYKILYRHSRYLKLFSLLKESNTFLFLGFSFDDLYIQKLFKLNKDIFNKPHYILLENPSNDVIKDFRDTYNLKVLSIKVNSPADYAIEIRKVLNQIAEVSTNKQQINSCQKSQGIINFEEGQYSLWGVPYKRNPFFMGRKMELKNLEKALKSQDIAVIQAISGLGGVGKTQLALEFCYQKKEEYDVIYWINAENISSITGSYEELASILKLPIKDKQNNSITLEIIKQWMQTNSNWLIVFDNLTDEEILKSFLPNDFEGKVIVTTRKSNISSLNYPINLDKFTRDESIQFILDRLHKLNNFAGDAKILAETLDDLPLALEQACAYIIETGISIENYLKRFKKFKDIIIKEGKPIDYDYTIATTWEISFGELKKRNPMALEFISICSFLSPDKIELGLFIKASDNISDIIVNKISSELELDKILALLREFSLIKSHEDSISIHRLVQLVIKNKLDLEQKKSFIEIALTLVLDNWNNIKNKESQIAHSLIVIQHAQKYNCCMEKVTKIINLLGKLLINLGQFHKAKELLFRALDIDMSIYNQNHFYVGRDYNSIGVLYTSMGEYNEAESYFQKSVDINQFNGTNRIDLLINLASLKYRQGLLHEAAQLYRNIMRNIEKNKDIEKDEILSAIYINLGSLLNDMGEYGQAKLYLKEIITYLEKHISDDKSPLIRAYNNLSLVYESLGEFEKAIKNVKKAIELTKIYLTEDSMEMVECYNNLGLYYFRNYEFNSNSLDTDKSTLILARDYLKKSLIISRKLIGKEHISQNSILNNLGMVYEALDENIKAKENYEEGLNILYNFLGNITHSQIATIKYNLGNIIWKLGDYHKGKELLLGVLEDDCKIYGERNVEVAKDYRKLGEMYISQEEYSEAITAFRKAHNIFEYTLGANNYRTLITLHDLFYILLKTNNYTEAKRIFPEVRKSAKIVYGENSEPFKFLNELIL
ncbi:TPA: tetratricopeptide repeat protein [Bacillus thuringiensis]|nr:tetratricopeptide repeat protein [Bacillus thuringiensis]